MQRYGPPNLCVKTYAELVCFNLSIKSLPKEEINVMNCYHYMKQFDMSPFAVTSDEYEAHKVRFLRSIMFNVKSRAA